MPDDEIKRLSDYFELISKKYLLENFSEKEANEFSGIFSNLLKENDPFFPDKLAKRHGINSVLVLTIAEILERKDKSIDFIKIHVLGIYNIIMGDYLKNLRHDFENTDQHWDSFIKFIKKGNSLNYENKYFELEVVQESLTTFEFNITKCLYYETLKRNERPDLAPILCAYDYLLADTIHQWVKFEREKTIANGNQFCGFRYLRANPPID
ncbi:MAG: hypothetical protein HeimC3_06740 [Candidatus Heimdallarchaeota archaeon LC_3]|nr:MAG: hypothetical protein HeimC3_06740 [Candidatus Heimdallarchaeota archaeon LC_3]